MPIARAGRLADLVVAEQQCCPFLTFRITLAGGHVVLDAHAPDGAQALLAGLLGEQAPHGVPGEAPEEEATEPSQARLSGAG